MPGYDKYLSFIYSQENKLQGGSTKVVQEKKTAESALEHLKKEKAVLFVYSDGCSWCEEQKKVFEKKETLKLNFAKIEASKCDDTLPEISAYPTFMYMKDNEVKTLAGYQENFETLQSLVN